MKKILVFVIISMFFISFASAGLFDWLTHPKPKIIPYKPAFNISNDFITNKIILDSSKIYQKITEKLSLEEAEKYLSYSKNSFTDLTKLSKNYFMANSQGITRFKNG